MDLTRSWISVVCSTGTLTPDLARSACRHLPEFSSDSDKVFWALVQQDFNAKYARRSEPAGVDKLRCRWEQIRPCVAAFDQVFAELWPHERPDRLDALPSQKHHLMLKRALEVFQAGTGQQFQYLGVWNILVRHAKWSDVLKPLVEDPSSEQETVGTKRPEVAEGKDDQESEEEEAQSTEEKATSAFVRPVACITPTGSEVKARKKQRLEGEAKAYSVIRQHNEQDRTEDDRPGNVSNTPSVATVDSKPQGDTPKVNDVHLTLAWIGVSCSFADASPKLEETYDWFWFLVSSYYNDYRPDGSSRCDDEDALKGRWHELRSRVVEFHAMFESAVAARGDVARMDREEVIAQALETYWKRNKLWFQHRAVWEMLERHVDWEAVLKPLLLRSEGSGDIQDAQTVERVEEETASSNSDERAAPKERDEGANPAQLPRLSLNDRAQLPLIKQWLDLSTCRLEMNVMTQKTDDLSPQALEYFRLKRRQILKKARRES